MAFTGGGGQKLTVTVFCNNEAHQRIAPILMCPKLLVLATGACEAHHTMSEIPIARQYVNIENKRKIKIYLYNIISFKYI